MPRRAIESFTREHLDQAASLLAGRQSAQRAVEPVLAIRYEDPDATRAELDALYATEGASGAVALDGDRVVGFLFGAPRADPLWGPNVWVEAAGHAVTEAEIVRDLYAVAAARWVEEGRRFHYAVVPTHDPKLVDAWFRLGFGYQHAHALRELGDEPPAPVPAGVSIRPPTRADIPELARIDLLLPDHHARSPVFSAGVTGTFDDTVAEWEDDFDDDRFTHFVAELGGRLVGFATLCPLEVSRAHAGMAFVDGAAFLGFAALDPDRRGIGIGAALFEARREAARRAGYTTLVTDFRMTNLLSSRFFERRHFRTTFARLFRAIV